MTGFNIDTPPHGKKSSKQDFFDDIDHSLEHIDHHQAVPQAESEAMRLVEKDAFEDWLLLSGITSKAETIYHKSLRQLNSQFSLLYQQQIDDANNPICPATICHQFQKAFTCNQFQSKILPVLYSVLEAPLLETLKQLYTDAHELLNNHHFPVRIEPETATHRTHEQAGATHAQEHAADTPPEQASTFISPDWKAEKCLSKSVGSG